VRPLTEQELKALEMPEIGPPEAPSKGLGTKPTDKPMGPQRAPPAPDLGVPQLKRIGGPEGSTAPPGNAASPPMAPAAPPATP
jgi:hypothetical protein